MKKLETEIKVENLKAWYGHNEVIKGISLNIYKNQITSIIGPSGCGKSTFLRCLNRMHEVNENGRIEGKVLIGKENIYRDDINIVELRKKVGMIFQRPNVFPTLSIFENVAAGLILNGFKDKNKLQEIIERSLTHATLFNEVKDRLKQSPWSLSGGQQQRLCIARALAVEPEILLMDEPTSALDPISISYIEDLMQELKKNITIVIVTHNMEQACRASDYMAFLLNGELMEYNKTETMYMNPKNEITQDYLSSRFKDNYIKVV